jgi:hypothetical protein
VLEFGSQVALEVVFDDEDAEEIGIASSTQDVPGRSSEAETSDGHRMKATETVPPTLGEGRPEENGAAGKNNCCGAFG